MEDISLIEHRIRFHQGCRVDIWDNHSENYLLEFYEREGEEWGLVQSFHTVSKFSFYHLMVKKFSTEWQVRISGWEDEKIKPLVIHTYTHKEKDILLVFDSDSFEEHKVWISLASEMEKSYNCRLTVVSRFHNRFKESSKVDIVSEIPDNYTENFYSSFVIGRCNSISQFNEIFSISYMPKSLDLPLTNGSNPYYSSYHRNNFIRMTSEELFKDIMNL